MLLTLFYLFYVYAVMGIIFFNTETNVYKEGSPYIMNEYTSFNNFGNALLALLQVFNLNIKIKILA